MKTKRISGKLTVIIRDITPFVHLQEPPTHRTVHIQLTEEQINQLELRSTSTLGGDPLYEDISACFFEEPQP